jgi:hypothetical protein
MALAVGLREPYTWEQELEAGDVRSVSDLAVDHRLVLVVQPQQVCGQALHFLFLSLNSVCAPLCLSASLSLSHCVAVRCSPPTPTCPCCRSPGVGC